MNAFDLGWDKFLEGSEKLRANTPVCCNIIRRTKMQHCGALAACQRTCESLWATMCGGCGWLQSCLRLLWQKGWEWIALI